MSRPERPPDLLYLSEEQTRALITVLKESDIFGGVILSMTEGQRLSVASDRWTEVSFIDDGGNVEVVDYARG